MRNIYILIVILITFTSGVLIAKNHYEPDSQQRIDDFQHYDQYNPEYMNYTDDEMLEMCDKHNLIYDYDNGECINEEK